MEATLYQDGMLLVAAPPIIINNGTPATGKLGEWSAVAGNEIMLRNFSAMSLNYLVSLTEDQTHRAEMRSPRCRSLQRGLCVLWGDWFRASRTCGLRG